MSGAPTYACKLGQLGRVALDQGRNLANDEWWKLKAGNLRKIGAAVADIQPDEVYRKPDLWPIIKLVWLQYSLGFYVTLLEKQRQQGNVDGIHFIDTCAGSGLNQFSHPTKKDTTLTVAGTALIGAQDCRFAWYHFVEPKEKYRVALEARLERFIPEKNYTVYGDHAKDAIPKIVSSIEKKSKRPNFMAFVDPEGFKEVTIDHLSPLMKSSRGDLFFNFQNQMGARGGAVTQAVRNFLGDQDWNADMTEEQLTAHFQRIMAAHERPRSGVVTVAAGGAIRYAYDVVWCASQTIGGDAWMNSFRDEVKRRMPGVTGDFLNKVLFGGQKLLGGF